jgi:hypothetical protein
VGQPTREAVNREVRLPPDYCRRHSDDRILGQ